MDQNTRTLTSTVALTITSLLLAAILSPGQAVAGDSLTWFGNDARNAAMGRGGEAAGTGPGNLLINPALMPFRPGGAWLSFSMAPNWLNIRTQDRPTDYDVPVEIYRTEQTGWLDRPIPTELLTNSHGPTDDIDTSYLISLAAIGSFGIPGFRAGIGATLPLPTLISFNNWYNDEREQHFTNQLHFERFGEFDNVFSIYPAAAYSPVEWLSLGLALKLDLTMGLTTSIYFPQGDEWEHAYVAPDVEVTPALRPIAALAFRTPIGLNFGAVYRHESYLDVELDIKIRIWNVEEGMDGPQNVFNQSHRFVVGYQPHEVSLAAAYEHESFSLELGGSWQHWSAYLDRHGNDWTQPGAGPGESWDEPEFHDTFTLHFGGEIWVSELAALRAGIAYYPSPMPDQTGRYNYVDNDLLLYSLGAGFRFDVLGRTVTTDLAFQLWHMRLLTVNKKLPSKLPDDEGGLVDEVRDGSVDYESGDPLPGADGLQTNNPGFPGYTLGGVLLNVAIMIGLEFG